jgi:hypothetical protein
MGPAATIGGILLSHDRFSVFLGLGPVRLPERGADA